jgi:hypothetical protein
MGRSTDGQVGDPKQLTNVGGGKAEQFIEPARHNFANPDKKIEHLDKTHRSLSTGNSFNNGFFQVVVIRNFEPDYQDLPRNRQSPRFNLWCAMLPLSQRRRVARRGWRVPRQTELCLETCKCL